MRVRTAHLKQEKRCPSCGEVKPRSAFAVCTSRAGGWSSNCKACLKKISHEHYVKQKAHKSKNLGSMLSYRARMKGVIYTYETPKKQWGVYRDHITYKCAECGQPVCETRQQALEHDFVCPSCLLKQHAEQTLTGMSPVSSADVSLTQGCESSMTSTTKPSEENIVMIFRVAQPTSQVKPQKTWWQRVKHFFDKLQS